MPSCYLLDLAAAVRDFLDCCDKSAGLPNPRTQVYAQLGGSPPALSQSAEKNGCRNSSKSPGYRWAPRLKVPISACIPCGPPSPFTAKGCWTLPPADEALPARRPRLPPKTWGGHLGSSRNARNRQRFAAMSWLESASCNPAAVRARAPNTRTRADRAIMVRPATPSPGHTQSSPGETPIDENSPLPFLSTPNSPNPSSDGLKQPDSPYYVDEDVLLPARAPSLCHQPSPNLPPPRRRDSLGHKKGPPPCRPKHPRTPIPPVTGPSTTSEPGGPNHVACARI